LRDFGVESGSTVSKDYSAETSRFNGTIHWVQLDLSADDADQLNSPNERLRVAMARQ
jgi:arylsulfatase